MIETSFRNSRCVKLFWIFYWILIEDLVENQSVCHSLVSAVFFFSKTYIELIAPRSLHNAHSLKSFDKVRHSNDHRPRELNCHHVCLTQLTVQIFFETQDFRDVMEEILLSHSTKRQTISVNTQKKCTQDFLSARAQFIKSHGNRIAAGWHSLCHMAIEQLPGGTQKVFFGWIKVGC